MLLFVYKKIRDHRSLIMNNKERKLIKDTIKNLNTYSTISENFGKAARLIESIDLTDLSAKNYGASGDDCYAFLTSFDLKELDDVKYEAHERYCDIQLVLDGEEGIFVADRSNLTICDEYDEQKDIMFYQDTDHFTKLTLKPQEFAVFFPWDAHKPCCRVGEAKHSVKLVVKVKFR